MSTVPQGLLYTADHEWCRVEGDVATVGVTDYAQKALGDVTFVELPPVGKELARGDEACAIESCKAAASVYAPASGKVIEVNTALADDPGSINADPYGAGWLIKLALRDGAELSSLKSPEEYAQFLPKE